MSELELLIKKHCVFINPHTNSYCAVAMTEAYDLGKANQLEHQRFVVNVGKIKKGVPSEPETSIVE